MRTTIIVDSDVMTTVREYAESADDDMGATISKLARSAMHGSRPNLSLEWDDVLGIYILPRTKRKTPLTLEEVNRLRDEDE